MQATAHKQNKKRKISDVDFLKNQSTSAKETFGKWTKRSPARNGELERIIKTLEGLEDPIRKRYKAEIVGLFGSYVRGEQKKGSDVDVLVRFLKGATLLSFTGLANFLEEELKVKVDIVPDDTIRKEIKDHVLGEAIYL